MNGLAIRAAAPSDRPQLRRAVIELHDHEPCLHSSRLPGDQTADAYLAWMEKRAADNGAVLIAEINGAFAGFVAGWLKVENHIEETPNLNRFGYVSDICVLPDFRGRRIASELLEAEELHLRREGVTRVRLCTLAANSAAGQATNVRATMRTRSYTRNRYDLVIPPLGFKREDAREGGTQQELCLWGAANLRMTDALGCCYAWKAIQRTSRRTAVGASGHPPLWTCR